MYMNAHRSDSREKRFLDDVGWMENDPIIGLANMFDIGMAFAAALLLALVTFYSMQELVPEKDVTFVKNPGAINMEIIMKKGTKLEKYRMSQQRGIGGEGERLGICYRLKTGEVIYVPEEASETGK
jgi:hypothetical protein